MIIHIHTDSVRSRVHRKLLLQAFPQKVIRCAQGLDASLFDGLGEGAEVVALVCLNGVSEPHLGSWLSALRGQCPEARWFPVIQQNGGIPEWVGILKPECILFEPLDVHAIKVALSVHAS